MRRILALALVVAASAALVPTPAATAAKAPLARVDRTFTVYGSGWGHGLGLSQWGSYGLAKQGWSAERILTYFYSGTSVVEDQSPPGEIRVELTSGRRQVRLEAEGGPVRLWARRPGNGKAVGTIPAGETWIVKAVGGAYEVYDATGTIVGGRPWGSASSDLFATYADAGARVTVPEGGATYNRGSLELDLTGCPSGCAIRLVVQLPFEEYLLGLGEVPSSWPMEALRAQAVAARSFALYKIRQYGVQASCECNLSDGSNDQVYIGWNKEGGTDGARWVKAVETTAGKIVSYEGSVALTVYTASDGGHTEDLNVQWGTPLSSFPYLAGVCDPGEYTPANPWTDWSRRFPVEAFTGALAPYTGPIGTVQGFGKIVRGVSGRIQDAVVRGTDGEATITGAELRSALSLPDDRVWINTDRNILGDIRVKYDALMCEPGLPTSTAKTLPGGSRQTFQVGAIYRNADVGVSVWLKGAVYDEYLVVGGATGTLGLPTADPMNVGSRRRGRSCPSGCTRTDFAGGRVYWKGGLGAFALWGDVLDAYLDRGGAGGPLGFPTSRVQPAGDGESSATFERGTISCAAGTCRVS